MSERLDMSEGNIGLIAWSPEVAKAAVPWMKAMYIDDLGKYKDQELVESIVYQFIDRMAQDNRSTVYGLTVDGDIHGVLGILHQNPLDRTADIFAVASPRVRGTGLGRSVGEWLVSTLVPDHFLTLRAFCRGHNPIVVNLLKKLGFEEQEFTGTYLEYTNG